MPRRTKTEKNSHIASDGGRSLVLVRRYARANPTRQIVRVRGNECAEDSIEWCTMRTFARLAREVRPRTTHDTCLLHTLVADLAAIFVRELTIFKFALAEGIAFLRRLFWPRLNREPAPDRAEGPCGASCWWRRERRRGKRRGRARCPVLGGAPAITRRAFAGFGSRPRYPTVHPRTPRAQAQAVHA